MGSHMRGVGGARAEHGASHAGGLAEVEMKVHFLGHIHIYIYIYIFVSTKA